MNDCQPGLVTARAAAALQRLHGYPQRESVITVLRGGCVRAMLKEKRVADHDRDETGTMPCGMLRP